MKCIAVFALALLVSFVLAQSDCDLNVPYACTGGSIIGLDFDNGIFFDTVILYENSGSCSIVQSGDYDTSGSNSNVVLTFDSSDCDVTGTGCSATCSDRTITFVASDSCGTLTGPNGLVCRPSNQDCDTRFTCNNGATPVGVNGYNPTTNGCGPQSFPLAGPSFSFIDCCAQHDFCYSTCNSGKTNCDNDFYTCTYCSCQVAYDNFLSRGACEELACAYYQAVDEFGCDAYNSGQSNGCSCNGGLSGGQAKDAEHDDEVTSFVNKFGPISPLERETELICDAPFDVNTNNCPAPAASATRTPAQNVATQTRAASQSRGASQSRTNGASRSPSRSVRINTNSIDTSENSNSNTNTNNNSNSNNNNNSNSNNSGATFLVMSSLAIVVAAILL